MHAGTVAELLDRWLEQALPSWSPGTRRETTSLVQHHLKVQLGSIVLAEITTAEIDAFYTRLLRESGRNGQPLAAGTVHRVHVVLHRAVAQAHRWRWIWLNPASTASPLRVEPSEIDPPRQDELALLLARGRADELGAAFVLAAGCHNGKRRGELLALRWGDVDFERATRRSSLRSPKVRAARSSRPQDTAHELHRARRVDGRGARRVPVTAVSRCGDRRAVCLLLRRRSDAVPA